MTALLGTIFVASLVGSVHCEGTGYEFYCE